MVIVLVVDVTVYVTYWITSRVPELYVRFVPPPEIVPFALLLSLAILIVITVPTDAITGSVIVVVVSPAVPVKSKLLVALAVAPEAEITPVAFEATPVAKVPVALCP
jgi:hypothetical protein